MIGNKSINIKNYLSTIASPSFKKILALLLMTLFVFLNIAGYLTDEPPWALD